MDTASFIKSGKASLGIEFGSTRIKAVLVGEDFSPAAMGTYDWENRFEDGVWTYSLDDIKTGLQTCFKSLCDDVKAKYGVELVSAASIGISAMMHGYLAFDGNDELLTPFRTWRNTMTAEAADILTEKFGFNIPQRWSIAHLYGAVLRGEEHVPSVRFITTLAGYVHFLLTGKKVLGVGDASGMFPIDSTSGAYNEKMLVQFDELVDGKGFAWKLKDILPSIVKAGECAGVLTEQGASLLDPTGTFKAGVQLCPPEGDAQTGMVATNSIAEKTGNVSAGTSIFAMAVLEKELKKVHKEIDIVTTPCGAPVAMVHCNNCTGDIDAWVKLIHGMLSRFGVNMSKGELYDRFYEAALSGREDCGGVVSCNYFSGEHVTGLTRGVPFVARNADSEFSFENFARSLIYSSMATLKIGMDILTKEENVRLEKIMAHGGLFKSPVTGQKFLAAALGVDVALLKSAGEGGAWGIALLAAYSARENRTEELSHWLNERVFGGQSDICMKPSKDDTDGFESYSKAYLGALEIERTAALKM